MNTVIKMRTMGCMARVPNTLWPDKREMVEAQMRKTLERAGCIDIRFSEPGRFQPYMTEAGTPVEGGWELEAYGEAPE